MADDLVMMPGSNGGSLRVGGPGRPPSQVAVAIRGVSLPTQEVPRPTCEDPRQSEELDRWREGVARNLA